jgi:hypothetical protein
MIYTKASPATKVKTREQTLPSAHFTDILKNGNCGEKGSI